MISLEITQKKLNIRKVMKKSHELNKFKIEFNIILTIEKVIKKYCWKENEKLRKILNSKLI